MYMEKLKSGEAEVCGIQAEMIKTRGTTMVKWFEGCIGCGLEMWKDWHQLPYSQVDKSNHKQTIIGRLIWRE